MSKRKVGKAGEKVLGVGDDACGSDSQSAESRQPSKPSAQRARREVGENCVAECCAGAAWSCDKCGDCASMWDAISRLEAAARLAGRLEQAEKDAILAEHLGCEPREINALGQKKQLPGCGNEIAFAIRQERDRLRKEAGE